MTSASEKEKKSFPTGGRGPDKFFYFAIRGKNPPQNNALKVEFIPVLDERIDCLKKNKRATSNHLKDLKTLHHELPTRSLMPWLKPAPLSRKKPAEPACRKIRTFREDC